MIDTKELRELYAKATPGEWIDSDGYGDMIFAPSEKGGTFIVAQVRGWGYFTGNGSGGMGMSDTDAMEQQNYNAGFIAACHNAMPELLDEIERLRTELVQSVRLPFPIGTKVFCIDREGVLHGHVSEQIVNGYSESEWHGKANSGKDAKFIICHNSYNQPNAWEMRNVFLTRAEAEAMKGGAE